MLLKLLLNSFHLKKPRLRGHVVLSCCRDWYGGPLPTSHTSPLWRNILPSCRQIRVYQQDKTERIN